MFAGYTSCSSMRLRWSIRAVSLGLALREKLVSGSLAGVATMTRGVSDISIGIAAVATLALIIGAYFLGVHQGASTGPRFVPAHDSTPGFMFDNKTAQICWAAAPENNPSLPKPSADSGKSGSLGEFQVLDAPKPGIPTCKSLL